MTDHELLQSYVQHQSADALCELARRHSPMVRAAALRGLGDPHAADDATQAVFLVLMRKAPSLSPRVQLGGWLFQTTRYVVADIHRERRRRAQHEQEAARMTPQQVEHVAPETLAPLLNDALAGLRAADREAVILRYLEGRPTADVAAALRVTENTARQRIARALARLRKQLAKRGLLATAVALAAALDTPAAPAAPLPPVLESLLRGTPPAAPISALSQGALHMMTHAHRMFVGSVAAGVVLAAAAGLALAAAIHPAAPATSAAATAPAYGPQATPKGTIESAYKAALAGETDAFIRCFDGLTAEQTTALKQVSHAMNAMQKLRAAAAARFGAGTITDLPDPVGVAFSDIQKAEEKTEGNSSTVDLHGAGPGTISLVKSGTTWKIQADVLKTLNVRQVAQVDAMVPAIDGMTVDVAAGKYPSVQALQRAFGNALSPPANR
jgi:RNA polymerase sigma factor (sigma-70 family)